MRYYLISADGELEGIREISEATVYHWDPSADLAEWYGTEAEAAEALAEAISEGLATSENSVIDYSELECMWDEGGPEAYLGHPGFSGEWISQDEFGKRYDRHKAEEILHRTNDLPAGDLYEYTETLYRNADDEYFLVGSGGAGTRWASERENGWTAWGHGIQPISEAEAMMLIAVEAA